LPLGKTGVLVNIQALRGVAALLVVFVHLETPAERAGINPALLTFGNSGVDLFFVISGVIMVVTTARADVTAGSFIAHRIARVVPLYWLITLVVFMIALLAPG
jgi:peptidoglycan/LPS O-acetylase OafA/YrhL